MYTLKVIKAVVKGSQWMDSDVSELIGFKVKALITSKLYCIQNTAKPRPKDC